VRFFKPGKSKDTMALGTPGYAAPEASQGQTDERSDLYSLCVVLHQLLTGHSPAETIYSLPPARQLNPAISPELEQIIMRGLDNKRDRRWPSVEAMRVELARVGRARSPEPYPAGVPGMVAPAGGGMSAHNAHAGQARVGAAQGSSGSAARPTTRLLMVATRLTGRQLALLAGAIVVVLAGVTWFLAPMLETVSFDWNNVLVMAIFGALGYTAYPKRGMAFASHALLSMILVITLWTRLGAQGYEFINLVLGAIVSGVFMEIWVAFLPRIKGEGGGDAWLREAGWMAAMAAIGTSLFMGMTTSWAVTGLKPMQLFFSLLLGMLGWFLGDLFNQYQFFRQTGLWRGAIERDR
jgi:hypothetical protein